MDQNNIDLKKALKKYFGFVEFRGLQEEVIKSIMAGNDTLAIMSTGGGKSVCYQLPALIKKGIAIVVSPLIALMKNQVDAMNSISNENTAHFLNSSLNKAQIKKVKSDVESGLTKLLYLAPESLVKEEYIDFLIKQCISFFAIDEAHCISEWGHDFRIEYRNLKKIITHIKNVPIIALTATATTKVQEDIVKILQMKSNNTFKSSFNRPNLFYEVRQKTQNVIVDIISFIKQREGECGIIYCLSRKEVEKIAQVLQINGISALPYHAGLDDKLRMKHQDMFLMENVNVIVATIAFGMGIDKSNVRYVIHYTIPKSLESYYQETGRAGRDGKEGYCLTFYSRKDIEKLKVFLERKPLLERELGSALLESVVGYAETSISRRKYLLHYFGEDFDEVNDVSAMMDDNSKNPKNKVEAMDDVSKVLEVVNLTKGKYKLADLVCILRGESNMTLIAHEVHKKSFFAIGSKSEVDYWEALIRQLLISRYIEKYVECYGELRITKKGLDFLMNPVSFMMIKNYEQDDHQNSNHSSLLKNKMSFCVDEKLMVILESLRNDIAKKNNVPPYIIFQDPSLQDMTLKYPTTIKELLEIQGVGEGKVKKYGKEFIDLITAYVVENNIIKLMDLVVKTTGEKSALKLYIIQNTDRKIALENITQGKGMEMDELIKEMEAIVYSGTKLNIDYHIDGVLDKEHQEEILNYFLKAQNDNMKMVLERFQDDYNEEELRLMRIKFISDFGN